MRPFDRIDPDTPAIPVSTHRARRIAHSPRPAHAVRPEVRRLPRCCLLPGILRWILPALALAGTALPSVAATATIDAAATHQVIRGFGGVTGWRPPLDNVDADLLYGNDTPGQIGLTIYRIRIAPDRDWANEVANAQKAAARGATIFATPWTPPAEMKTNNNIIGGSLRPDAYGAYRDYLNGFVSHMAANGIPLHAISLQNEPEFAPDYEGCVWTAQNFLTFCRDFAGSIRGTRVMMPESLRFDHALSDPVLNDPGAAANVDLIGGHIYGGGLQRYPLAEEKGKEVWMTEHLELTTDWAGAMQTAREIHDCLSVANFNAYLWWYLKRFYGPLDEDTTISKRGYVMGHYAKFVRPGYVRIAATNNPATGVYVSAYRGPKLVIVAINTGATAATQTFAIQGRAVASFAPWTTSATVNMAEQPAIAAVNGTFTATLPASSITTFVENLAGAGPAFSTQPQSQSIAQGESVVLDAVAVAPPGGSAPSYAWQRNGVTLAPNTPPTLVLADVQPADAGLFGTVATSGGADTASALAIVGLASAQKVIGAGEEVDDDVRHPTGRVFDQVLLTGAAATITADHAVGQITRLSFLDLDHDIVQVEFSGPGSLTLVLDDVSGPALPLNYDQNIRYVRGHASIVVTGATEDTHLSVFTVGRATAFDPENRFDFLKDISAQNDPRNNGSPLFRGHDTTDYDGIADLAFIAISSTDGKFGGLRTANVNYFARKGLTGVYAPRVTFVGPVFLGDITAFEDATPAILIGSANDVRITGGSLAQANGRAVHLGGVRHLRFTDGSDSHGTRLLAQANQAVLVREGIDVTAETLREP